MDDNKNSNYVITVGRQMGSGGRELGKALATRLGISYYDKELLVKAAGEAGMSLEFFEKNDERFPRWINGVFSFAQGYLPLNSGAGNGTLGGDRCYSAMSDMMRRIAGEQSCVIVGRTGDYILREHPRLINIFVHAPVEHCVARIMRRGDTDDPAKARALVEKTNRLRADFYNFYTEKRWGDAASYDLTIDSSLLPVEKSVELIVGYMRLRGIAVD